VELIQELEASAIGAACRLDEIDLDAPWEASRTVGYPILPLVRQIAGHLPPGPGGRVHYGATTQDIMDTALSLQLGSSCERLFELAVSFGDGLSELARSHARTPMAARTHGQQAVPTTFGAKCATFLCQLIRVLDGLHRTRRSVRVVSLFGAGGTSAAMGPKAAEVRRIFARALGLDDVVVPWHVSRDRVVEFGNSCSLLAATCVRFAREIIDLARTEIAEVREEYGYHRGASSTMPQKVNPIFSESVLAFGVATSGISSLLYRAMEAGHERSAGEWQLEWLAIPQIAEYSAAALDLSAQIASTLEVYPDVMVANMTKMNGFLMSESIMMALARVTGRERAHDLVYAAAVEARSTGEDLFELCLRALEDDELARSLRADLVREPTDYLGDAPEVALEAVRQWEAARPLLTSEDKRN
jgi:3-carboxy-cis,cis-muconate cycloisomerase